MKFETINNTLCRMVEPEPLRPESQFPCVVRLIQDDSPMGRYNQSYSEYRYGVRLGCCMLPIIATHIAKNGVVNDIEWDVNRYEIVGYPVVDGSAEWALWQRQNKKSVITDTGVTGVVMHYHYDDETCAALLRAYPTGWQLYEPKPESQYKVGDWVEHKESKEQATIRRIMSYGAIEIEFAYSTESDIYQANDFHNDFRKLSPSEVIVKIGCLEGTVTYAISDDCFLLAKVNDPQHRACCIDMSMLDTATRELVESLLKAQEEK